MASTAVESPAVSMRVPSATARSSRSTSTRSCAPSAAAASGLPRRRPDARRHAGRSAASTTAPPRASSTSSRSRPRPRSSPRSRSTRSLAARLLATYIDKEVRNQEIHAFSQSIAAGAPARPHQRAAAELRRATTRASSTTRSTPSATSEFEYFGLRTLYDRYLLKHPHDAPGHRDAAAVLPAHRLRAGETVPEALELYRLFSVARVPAQLADAVQRRHAPRAALELLPARLAARTTWRASTSATPTSRMLSKFSGGIGLAYHRVRSRGSLIAGTNGHSNGIVPWLKTLDASVAAVNQGGKRKGACCVYLEPWHADIEEFLELRDNTGDEARRTHNLNLANWVPDLFMRASRRTATGSLFDPKAVPAAARPLRRGVRARPTTQAEARGPGGASTVQGARALRAHDADAGADRQRLDDLQGQVATAPCNQTALPGQRRPPLEPLHRDPRGDLARRDGGLQPRLDQPGAPHRVDADGACFDFDKLGAHRARSPCVSSTA